MSISEFWIYWDADASKNIFILQYHTPQCFIGRQAINEDGCSPWYYYTCISQRSAFFSFSQASQEMATKYCNYHSLFGITGDIYLALWSSRIRWIRGGKSNLIEEDDHFAEGGKLEETATIAIEENLRIVQKIASTMGDQGSSPMELEDGKLEQTAMPSSESIDKHYEKEQPQFTRSETLLPHPPPPIPPSPNPKFLLPRAPENQHTPQILPNIHSKVYPDDNSPVYESIAQGLPPDSQCGALAWGSSGWGHI